MVSWLFYRNFQFLVLFLPLVTFELLEVRTTEEQNSSRAIAVLLLLLLMVMMVMMI